MQQQTVASFKKDDRFEGFLLVRTAEQRTAGNGGKYLDMTLCDKTGDMNAKMWDGTVAPPVGGSVVKVRATIQEYNGRLQMRIERMRRAVNEDNADVSLLMPCAPEPPESMRGEIDSAIERMANEDLRKIMKELLAMAGDSLAYFPAAQRLHHAERSGLLHHTLGMLRAAEAILPLYPFLDGDLLRAGVIAHDLSKIDELLSDESGNVSDYSADGLLIGHLVRGVSQVEEAARRAGVQGEYVMLLQHMVISHHGVAEFGSPRSPMFPEAEMLHMLDDMDAKMNEMDGVLRRTPAGAFSEKIWSLDRRLYHPRYLKEAAVSADTEKQIPAPVKPAASNQPVSPIRPAAPARRIDAGKAYDGLL